MFGKSIFFFYKAVLFGIATVVAIPRPVYKKFLLYGFMFGALGDIILIIILDPGLKLIRYLNIGVFGVFGLFPFWTPIAWMFAFMLFFYFLPVRRVFLYPYVAGFAIFGYMVGMILEQMGLYQYIGYYKFISPLVLITWFALAAWVYIKSENVTLK